MACTLKYIACKPMLHRAPVQPALHVQVFGAFVHCAPKRLHPVLQMAGVHKKMNEMHAKHPQSAPSSQRPSEVEDVQPALQLRCDYQYKERGIV